MVTGTAGQLRNMERDAVRLPMASGIPSLAVAMQATRAVVPDKAPATRLPAALNQDNAPTDPTCAGRPNNPGRLKPSAQRKLAGILTLSVPMNA